MTLQNPAPVPLDLPRGPLRAVLSTTAPSLLEYNGKTDLTHNRMCLLSSICKGRFTLAAARRHFSVLPEDEPARSYGWFTLKRSSSGEC